MAEKDFDRKSCIIKILEEKLKTGLFFAVVVTLGLYGWNPTEPNITVIKDVRCVPGPSVGKDLVSFAVYALSTFLLSIVGSVVLICISKCFPNLNLLLVRIWGFVSEVVFDLGCIFLMFAFLNLVQLLLGTVSCPTSNKSYKVIAIMLIGFLITILGNTILSFFVMIW